MKTHDKANQKKGKQTQQAQQHGQTSHGRSQPPASPPTQERQTDKAGQDQLEGEGSYTATRRYRESLQRTVERGGTEQAADAAAQALDGPEGEELRQAEKAGKQGGPLSQS